jgi:hypothetical protein
MAKTGNVMAKMALQKQALLSYRVVFPDRHDKIEDLLSNIPSNTAIETMSYNLSMKENQSIDEHDLEIWAPWVMKTRADIKNPIGQYALQYNLGNYALIDEYAMLLLISRLLACYNGRNEELTQDDRSNLFLAYMICCDERLAMNQKLPNNKMKAEEFVESYMPECLKTYNVEAPRDYRLLMIKCYMLLIEFPKVNTRFAQYVDEFCKERDIPNAKYYLDKIFLTFLEMRKKDFSNCRMAIGENQKDISRFYDSLTLDPSHYQHDMDFLMMKEKPLIKTGPNIYNFMFMKMFLDKAYTGLLFDMKDALVKRGVLDPTMGYANLRSFLGEEFSERFFFYALMKRCFGLNYVNYSGEELEKTLGKGMPDYYLRRQNRVFVFECKDVQLAAKKKLSGDYETIKKAIFEKYVANSKGHAKGIGQLANVIVEKLPSILREVDKSTPNSVIFVYPVIVYFDDCFDVEGPNYLLNKEFQRIIAEKKVTADYEVKDVVMVNIEQLMGLENFFANEKLNLANLINSYIEYKEEFELNQVFPFNKYIFQESRKVGYELKKTRWFDEVFENLTIMDKKGCAQ